MSFGPPGELTLAYQPIVTVADGRVQAYEALLRWRRGGDVVAPMVLISDAERTGAIAGLGRWALDTALTEMGTRGGVAVSVNLSPRQLVDPTFVDAVVDALDRHGVSPWVLWFELTPHIAIDDVARAADVLGELHAMGCRIGMDDFGTGHGSLTSLARLPLDFVKLERSFLHGIERREVAIVVDLMLRMAGELGLDVVAKGVESNRQHQRVLDLGCRYGQGWWYGAPDVSAAGRRAPWPVDHAEAAPGPR